MFKLEYEITNIDPLVFTSGEGDENMVRTLDYIPGTSLLGLFAGKYIGKNNINDVQNYEKFRKLFLLGGLRFLNAYIVKQVKYKDAERCLPIPLSIQKIKENQGEALDLMFTEQDDEQTVAITGFGTCEGKLSKVETKKSINFHHTRINNRINGHAANGNIFNYESLDPDQTFKGIVLGKEVELKNFVKEMDDFNFEGSLGRSKATQYGRVKISKCGEIKEFSREINKSVKIADDKISLTLLSHAILYDESGNSSTDVKLIEKEVALELGEHIEIEKGNCFKRAVDVETYISVWCLPRPSEVAFKMGSCFLVTLKDKNVTNLDDKLKKLEKEGLGVRKGEGFGRVAINWLNAEGYEVLDSKVENHETQKPTDMPEILKGKIKEIIDEKIKEIVTQQAAEDQKEFKNLPSPSSISRLHFLFTNRKVGTFKIEEEFIGTLKGDKKDDKKGLRKTIKDNLKKSNNGNENLWEFITKRRLMNPPEPDGKSKENKNHALFNALNKKLKKYDDLFKDIEYSLTDFYSNEKKCADLYKTYWRTFFSLMRKESKKESKSNGRL